MLPNSSSSVNTTGPPRKEFHSGRSSFFARRLGLAILLPLWVLSGFILALVVMEIVGSALGLVGVSFSGINSAIQLTVSAALSYLLTVVIVIGLPRTFKKSRTTLSDLGLTRLPSWKDIAFGLAGFVVYLFVASVLLSLVTKYLPGFNADEAQDVGFSQLNGHYEYVLAFITLVVIAPVAEEVLMRGYLYGKLRKIMPIVVSMVITAVLFAVLHLQLNVGIDVFALSLVLTTLREFTGTIWSGMLVHMMKNGLAFYLLFINTAFLNTMGG